MKSPIFLPQQKDAMFNWTEEQKKVSKELIGNET